MSANCRQSIKLAQNYFSNESALFYPKAEKPLFSNLRSFLEW